MMVWLGKHNGRRRIYSAAFVIGRKMLWIKKNGKIYRGTMVSIKPVSYTHLTRIRASHSVYNSANGVNRKEKGKRVYSFPNTSASARSALYCAGSISDSLVPPYFVMSSLTSAVIPAWLFCPRTARTSSRVTFFSAGRSFTSCASMTLASRCV